MQAFFVTGGAGEVLDPRWCSPAYEQVLRRLRTPVDAEAVSVPELLLYRDATIDVFFAPLDQINTEARVAIVGLTPGRAQARIALETVSQALRSGTPLETAVRAAKAEASFAGTMRRNLVRMLDEIGLPEALALPSSQALFEEHRDLLATTSAVCHPVFVRGGHNYSGTPRLDRHPVLRAFAEQALRAALALVPGALVVPLGVEATRGVHLAGVDPTRVLSGFPHPSGGNGHRVATFSLNRAALTAAVASWRDSCWSVGRDGRPVGVSRPLLTREAVHTRWRHLPAIDGAAMSAEVDGMLDADV